MKVDGILEKKDDNNEVKKTTGETKYDLNKTIILALVGLILLFMPGTVNTVVGIIVGSILILLGGWTIYNYVQKKKGTGITFVTGILYVVLGFLVIFKPGAIMSLAVKCLGVYMIILSLLKLKIALTTRKTARLWTGTLIVAIIFLAFGVLLVTNPFSLQEITKLAGAFLVAVAVMDIIDYYILQRK